MSVEVFLWTDGSGTTSGPIGWAYVLRAVDPETGAVLKEREGMGAFPEGTSQRAELMAVIEGLLVLSRRARVTVVTDSKYVRMGATEWVAGWEKHRWRTVGPSERDDPDLAWQCPLCACPTKAEADVCARHDPPAAMCASYDSRAVRNRDLWQMLLGAMKLHDVSFRQVPGHDKQGRYPLNERADELAGQARRALIEACTTV
jgi:ribonuclease HI